VGKSGVLENKSGNISETRKDTEWSKKAVLLFYFCDNFRECTPLLTIFSLLEQ